MVTAPQLAHRYDAYLATLHAALGQRHHRRLGEVRAFMDWIEGCWRDDALPEPPAAPTAVSAGGWGIVRWHETAAGIRGYVPGLAGCYEVPRDDTPPAYRRPA